MPPPVLFCLAPSRGRADRIIHDLKVAEFSHLEVGALFFESNAEVDRARPRGGDRWAPSEAAIQSAAAIRGVLAWIAGIGRVIVPGVGSCIAAGPIVAALHQTRDGTCRDAIARALVHLGLSADEAARYERRIRNEGCILLSVQSPDTARVVRAREIFVESRALEISAPVGPAAPADELKTPGDASVVLPK